MAGPTFSEEIPVPEQTLRNISRDIVGFFPNLTALEPEIGVKSLHDVLDPLLETAESSTLSSSHRAAVCNVLCAILERCQALESQYIQEAILDDSIWSRAFLMYLEKSDNAKGKSVRQVLVTLTAILLRNQNQRAFELQNRTIFNIVDIICQRQDRIKVKPALQALAHFLQKDVATIPSLEEVYARILNNTSQPSAGGTRVQDLFAIFLSWVVHHDTSLSAGHLIKNFLAQLRRTYSQEAASSDGSIASIWIEPVVDCLYRWPDRMQEFKTHVFPHCFLPNVEEYFHFLSYLHFPRHVASTGPIPEDLAAHNTESNELEEFEEFRMLLASIQTGKELGIVTDVDYRLHCPIEIHHDALVLTDDIFGAWLSHMKSEVRLAGLFTCVYSTNITRTITGGIFKSLKKNLLHLHTDPDVNFRRELISYIQRLFNRLRGSTATLAKSAAKATSRTENRLPFPSACSKTGSQSILKDPLADSLQFIKWYIDFLEGEIRPDAAYQRRITALRALMVVLKSGLDPRIPHRLLSKGAQGQLHWAHGLQISNTALIRKLLDMMLDAFEDVRDTATSILQIFFESMPEKEKTTALTMLPLFINRAEATMLRTGRADHADGLARAYSLYYSCVPASSNIPQSGDVLVVTKTDVVHRLRMQLQETIGIAQNNLFEAVNGRPVHGIFAAIRYIVDHDGFYGALDHLDDDSFNVLKSFHHRFLEDFNTTWDIVKNILSADAPEGHVPEDMEEEISLDTKEILSYSWRGLKEASTLLRVLATRAPIGNQERDVITPIRFEELGRLCFTQLIELRHRGAFSAVAQTFAAFCRRCYSVEDESLRGLPQKWYQETLSSIQAQAHAITRRSGGIPALMAGIIASEPQTSGKLFPQAMQDLTVETSIAAKSSNIEESRLPQVHALNCIKEFFMTSKLGVSSEAYIGDGLELAARSINSNIWPIRNCGLMLFKALIERLLGSDEAQDWKERETTRTSRFSYHDYPALVGIIKALLNPEGPLKDSLDTPESNAPMDLHGAEGVFPALQILRQAMPPEDHRMAILQSVTRLLSSPHWHLRDMAARTIAALYRTSELLTGVKWLLDNFEDPTNAKHGKLLCIKYCFSKALQSNDQCQQFLREFMLHLSICTTAWYTEISCPYVKAAFIDLVTACGMYMIEFGADDATIGVWTALTTAIGIGPEHPFALNISGVDSLLQKSLAEVFFTDRVILRPERIEVYLAKEYQGIGGALQILAAEAPDTCAAALDTIDEVTQLKTLRGPVLQISLILHDVYCLVLSAQDAEVLFKAQSVLADGLSQPGMPQEVLDLIRESDLLATLNKLEEQCLQSAPLNAQSALHLLGYFLDYTYKHYPAQRHNIFPRIARYIRILRLTIVDTNPFDARFAAVNSTRALQHIWTLSPTSRTTGPLLLALAIVLYDMLNDDDDEIRDYAAVATTSLLNAHLPSTTPPLTPLVPILTTHRLAAFLITYFSTSPDLCKEAVRRLTSTPFHAPLFSTAFGVTFQEERKEDTTLFASEKQNLFIDPTLDAVFWARVLASLPPSFVPSALQNGLVAWVEEALEVFLETAVVEKDGALGWTSKVEVFTLGMRVLCAAGVVLGWESDLASESGVRIRKLLVEFSKVGGSSGVHGLWMEKLERLLEGAIVGVMRRVGERLRAVEMGLEEAKNAPSLKVKEASTLDEQSVLNFLTSLGARVRATEGGLMKKAGM
ncbi:HEAT repeat protein-like protein [Bimuria novae-zelandiae CBS 107.79]|uniref:HEAT repeat protein-like protein n=1 Tax=Bimuria novae-zelandiae CBS 107.79 TaxID=1447943 RepID=A0A6A5UH10_9PLEO|nr:HEAT repeat protein-like protein [Bimuria novae-zelandiae CBS 107.79]